ncbi:MAG: TolC family protein, partial [Verrucomicrobiales bacterium]
MNRNFTILLTLATLLLAGLPVIRAEDAVSLARDKAISLAFANHRELKIAALEIKRASSRVQWSGRLENPELELSASDDGVGLDEGEGNYEIAFSQRFPLTAKLKKETSLRRYQVILAEAEIAERRREIAGEVDRAVVELLATREKILLGREGITLNKEIVTFLEKKAKLGEASKLDVIQ